MSETVKRPYSSDLRDRQARRTRWEIVQAAGALFVAHGYVATTIDAIAAAAGVGRKTVFRAVGGKPECLKLAIDWAIAGDDEPVPLMARERIRTAMQSPDARWIVHDFAAHYTQTAKRSAALLEVLDGAAGLDPILQELHRELDRQRVAGLSNLAGHLRLRGALRAGLTIEDAAQLLCALGHASVYQRLVTRHGWPEERFAAWLGESLVAQLVEPGYEVGPLPRTAEAAALGVDVDALA
jgi:AcrR family transcriptional regulator